MSDGTTNGVGLNVKLTSDALVISLPLSALQLAVECFSDFEKYNSDTGKVEKPRVTDVRLFAREVLHALSHEGEDGSTLVTRMLDHAFNEAVENGAEGIRVPDDDLDEDDDGPDDDELSDLMELS